MGRGMGVLLGGLLEDEFPEALDGLFDGGFHFGALFRGDGEVAVAQAAGPVGVFQHHAAHAEGIVLVDFAGEGLPGEGPAADRIFGVVTAAAGDEEG